MEDLELYIVFGVKVSDPIYKLVKNIINHITGPPSAFLIATQQSKLVLVTSDVERRTTNAAII